MLLPAPDCANATSQRSHRHACLQDSRQARNRVIRRLADTQMPLLIDAPQTYFWPIYLLGCGPVSPHLALPANWHAGLATCRLPAERLPAGLQHAQAEAFNNDPAVRQGS